MMFLEFFIWGAWLPLIFAYLPSLGFSSSQQGWTLNAFAIGSLVAMFFSTQFADRNFAAEKFLAFMVSDTEVQAAWAEAQGALSANVNVDPASYNVVMQKAASTVAAAEAFAFNYDLATPPPVAEVGLSMFARFIDDPSQSDAILAQVATDAEAAFKQ